MSDSGLEKVTPSLDSSQTLIDHLSTVPDALAAYEIAIYLQDTDVERWARCSHRSLHQLQRYYFKESLALVEAIRISSASSSRSSRPTLLGRFGQAQNVWSYSDQDLALLSQLPSSVRRLCIDHQWPADSAAGSVASIPASVTEVYCATEERRAVKISEVVQLVRGATGLQLLKINWLDVVPIPPLESFRTGLPGSLINLALCDVTTHLPFDLPASLTDLRVPRYRQPASEWPRLPPNLRVLHCDHDAPIGELKLPASLTELRTFFYEGPWRGEPLDSLHLAAWSKSPGPPAALTTLSLAEFNEPVSTLQLHLPATLRTLDLPHFEHRLDELSRYLPDSITELTVSSHPSNVESLNRVRWPGQLQKLCFGPRFCLPLQDWNLPSGLLSLDLGQRWNLPTSQLCLPLGLHTLRFSAAFNQPLGTCLQSLLFLADLHLGAEFNQELREDQLPPNLTTLTLSNAWHLLFTHLRLPSSLRTLRFGTASLNGFHSLHELVLPTALTELDLEPCIAHREQQWLAHLQLPAGLFRLRLPRNLPLRVCTQLARLPPGLRELISPPNSRLRDWAEMGLPPGCVLLDDPCQGPGPFDMRVQTPHGC